MPAATAFIPSSANRSLVNSLVGPLPPAFIFKKANRHHIRQFPPPLRPEAPQGHTTCPKPIVFGLPGEWKQGMLVKDFEMQGQIIEGTEKKVFSELGIREVDLWIHFPGYERLAFFQIMDWGNKTKYEIGGEVCAFLKEFMKNAASIAPEQGVTDSKLVVGKDVVWEQLVLLEIVHFNFQAWQVNIAFDSK